MDNVAIKKKKKKPSQYYFLFFQVAVLNNGYIQSMPMDRNFIVTKTS